MGITRKRDKKMIDASLLPNTQHLSPKKAGIFDPYLDTLGGGERYCLTVAEALLNVGWEVDIFWHEEKIKKTLTERLFLDIERVNLVPYSPRTTNLLKRKTFESSYDFLFYLSDGSLPFMFGKKNILHFQVPFKHALKKRIQDSFKLRRINSIVCNSLFTKKIIDEKLKIDSRVIYPPVDVINIKPLRKENIILSVGRFSQLLQGKRQDVLVKVFKSMLDQGNLNGWKLVFVGGSDVGGRDFVRNLRQSAGSYPIDIKENLPFSEVKTLYGKSKIFWNASGFGIDEDKDPERVEHFGIATVEAMAAGCVPIVQDKGGQKEIVQEGRSGFLWLTTDELTSVTQKVAEDTKLLSDISLNAIKRSGDFSKEMFYQKIYDLT